MANPAGMELLPEDDSPYWEVGCPEALVEQFRATLLGVNGAFANNLRVYGERSSGQERHLTIVIPRRLIDKATLLDYVARANAAMAAR